MALRCFWSFGRASVYRNVIPVSGIHVGALEMQPTKVPLSDEEKKLLEKLGEPDSETRGYLNELYADFDVAAEKKREQRQEKKRTNEENQSNEPAKTLPTSSTIAFGSFSRRMFHTSPMYSDDHKNIVPSLKSTRKAFENESRIIWDSQENFDYYPENQKVSRTEGLEIPHGETGVFDVDVLVHLLGQEKLKDVAVIEVPAEMAYADYLVIATTLSKRQGRAATEFFKKLHKMTRVQEERGLKIEGADCDEWRVLDFGNIVLHMFDPEYRQRYDLESLWTVGHEFDELAAVSEGPGAALDVLSKHIEFVRSLSTSPITQP